MHNNFAVKGDVLVLLVDEVQEKDNDYDPDSLQSSFYQQAVFCVHFSLQSQRFSSVTALTVLTCAASLATVHQNAPLFTIFASMPEKLRSMLLSHTVQLILLALY